MVDCGGGRTGEVEKNPTNIKDKYLKKYSIFFLVLLPSRRVFKHILRKTRKKVKKIK